tara:strand:+ start:3953 stop:4213 length:261 start_codon:yes stop_codon:yes gene_type:complete
MMKRKQPESKTKKESNEPPVCKREMDLYMTYSIMHDQFDDMTKGVIVLMNDLRKSDNEDCRKILNEFVNCPLYKRCIEPHITEFSD